MKVKIIKSTSPSYWYADKIGEVFEVTDYDDKFFVKDNGFSIDKNDCEIIDGSYSWVGNKDRTIIELTTKITELEIQIRRKDILLKASKDSRLKMQKRLNEKCECIDRLKTEIVDLQNKPLYNKPKIEEIEIKQEKKKEKKKYNKIAIVNPGTAVESVDYPICYMLLSECRECSAHGGLTKNNKKIKCRYGVEQMSLTMIGTCENCGADYCQECSDSVQWSRFCSKSCEEEFNND